MLTIGLKAQVTIGSNEPPQKYSLLELSTKTMSGGIRMPQLTMVSRDNLPVTSDIKANGLVIYNSDTRNLEFWNGTKWVQLYQYNFTNGITDNITSVELGGNLTKATKLQATKAGQNMQFNSTVAGSNFIIDGSANLGLGVASPSERLHVDGNVRFDNLPIVGPLKGTETRLILDANNRLSKVNNFLVDSRVGGYRSTTASKPELIKTINTTTSITRVRFIYHVDASSDEFNDLQEAYLYGDFTIIGRNNKYTIVDVNIKNFEGKPATNVIITDKSITMNTVKWPTDPGIITLTDAGEIFMQRSNLFSFLFDFMGGF